MTTKTLNPADAFELPNIAEFGPVSVTELKEPVGSRGNGVGPEASWARKLSNRIWGGIGAKRSVEVHTRVDAPHWLESVYSHVSRGQIDEALDIVFAEVDELLSEGQFRRCDALLRTVDLKRLDTNLMIGWLSATLMAKSELRYRAQFVQKVESRLREEAPDRVERLLDGLR